MEWREERSILICPWGRIALVDISNLSRMMILRLAAKKKDPYYMEIVVLDNIV
jgi:hypothetical protein